MRRDIRRHTYRDSGSSVYQKIGITGGKHYRLSLRLVKVRLKINRILIDISQHLHGYLAETGFRVPHRRGSVAVYGTKVPVAVYQRISGGPVLSHIYKSAVNRTVAVGMIFTHGIADDTGAFTVRFIRAVIQLDHGIQNSSLHWLQSVPYIRKSAGRDNTHGIVDIRLFHGLLQIHLMDFIKNIVFHFLFS